MGKRSLLERETCTNYIMLDLRKDGSDKITQLCEEVRFTKASISVLGKLVGRDKDNRAAQILYHKPKEA